MDNWKKGKNRIVKKTDESLDEQTQTLKRQS